MSAAGARNQGGGGAVARRGLMLVISSPSGAGKTTLAKRLLARDSAIAPSISATTRAPRAGERDGVDYFFVTPETFAAMAEQRAFLEHAEVFGNRYGTPRAFVEDRLSTGRDVLFDIDWQGAQQLRAIARGDVASVFILPPSAVELAARLKSRAQDPADVIARRMAKAEAEISHWAEYDYVIVNERLDEAEAALAAILEAERRRRDRQPALSSFVTRMVAELDAAGFTTREP